MWPWEHVLVGYVVFSLFRHATTREPPTEREALLVAFGALLPDLVDKPLAWEFGVFESGYALAHSVLFAVPVALAAVLLSRVLGTGRSGLAFAVGYLLHLVGDVVPVYARTGEVFVDHLLWPVVVVRNVGQPFGLFEGVRRNLTPYVESVLAADPSTYFLLKLLVGGTALALWVLDGAPGPRGLYVGARRTYTTIKRYASPG